MMKPIKPGFLPALLALLLILTSCDTAGSLPATPSPLPTDTAAQAPPSPTAVQVLPTASPTTLPSSTPEPPPTQTETPVPVPRLLFLDADDLTVKTVRADGTGEAVLSKLQKTDGGSIVYFSSDPGGQKILYGRISRPEDYQLAYFLVDATDAGGPAVQLGKIFGSPRWSPQGSSFAAEAFKADGTPGAIFLYDLASGQRTDLPVEGVPDYLEDGSGLVYANRNNVFTYDLQTGATVQITHLPDDDQNAWTVQEAHPLSGGRDVIFFGGQFTRDGEPQLGAQGNGQQWWKVPLAGGEPQPWTEQGGNYIPAYANSPDGKWVAFVDSAHSSACISVETLEILPPSGGAPLRPTIPELAESETASAAAEGLSWSPDGSVLAIGVAPYTCSDAGAGRVNGTPLIYLWDASQGGSAQPRRLVNGYFPTWIR